MLYDAYWARHDLANTFEVEKRTQLPRDGSKVIFEPGEIAYAPGGLKHAFYSFLQSAGYKLTPREERFASGRAAGGGKYCVVLERVDNDTYWICYLTTFDRAASGGHITFASGRYFALALGIAPEWPPGFAALKTSPPWKENAYVYAAPILCKGLRVPFMDKGTAFMRRRFLLNGELERIRGEIVNKVTHFPRVAPTLRQEVLAREVEISRGGGLSNFDFVDEDFKIISRKHGRQREKPGRQAPERLTKEKFHVEPEGKTGGLQPLPNPGDTQYIDWPLRYLRHDLLEGYSYLSDHPPLGMQQLRRVVGEESTAHQQWGAYVSSPAAKSVLVSPDPQASHLNANLIGRINPNQKTTRERPVPHSTGDRRPKISAIRGSRRICTIACSLARRLPTVL